MKGLPLISRKQKNTVATRNTVGGKSYCKDEFCVSAMLDSKDGVGEKSQTENYCRVL